MKNLFSYCLLLLLTSAVLLQSCQKEQPSPVSDQFNYAELNLPAIDFVEYENMINSNFESAIQSSENNSLHQNNKEEFVRLREMLDNEGIVESIKYTSARAYMSDFEKDKMASVFQNLMKQLTSKVKPEKISSFLLEEGLKVQSDKNIDTNDKQLVLIYIASLKTIVDRSNTVFFGTSNSIRECEEWWQEAICSIYSFSTGWLIKKILKFGAEQLGVDLENCTYDGTSFPQFICDLINDTIASITSKETCCSWWDNDGDGGNGDGGNGDNNGGPIITECDPPCDKANDEVCVNGRCEVE